MSPRLLLPASTLALWALAACDSGLPAAPDATIVDGAVIDAAHGPVDARPIDAIAIDAMPVDLGSWPAPVTPGTAYATVGVLVGEAIGFERIAHATAEHPGPPPWLGFNHRIFVDGAIGFEHWEGFAVPYRLFPTRRGTFLGRGPGLGAGWRELGTGNTTTDCDEPLVGEMAGGVLCLRSGAVTRLAPDLSRDTAFGVGGRLLLPFPATNAVALAQGTAAASIVTLGLGTSLYRFDGVSGARLASFGDGGLVITGVPAARIIGLAPLAAAGVAVVERIDGAVVIHRVDADGARHPPLAIALATQPRRAFSDARGRVTLWLGFEPGAPVGRLIRIDTHTGQLDPTFGVDGRATFAVATCEPTVCTWTWDVAGVHADGAVVVRGAYLDRLVQQGEPHSISYAIVSP